MGGSTAASQAHCFEYFKLSKICILIDTDSQGSWIFDGWCDIEFNRKVNYPLESEVIFDNTLSLTVRSQRDPEIFFNKITLGKKILDISPVKEMIVGIIFLTCGGLMMLISVYRTYRFCLKYGHLRIYLQNKAAKKYELEDEKENLKKK